MRLACKTDENSQKPSWFKPLILAMPVVVAMLTGQVCAAPLSAAVPESLQAEIVQLQNLGDTQPDLAVRQLQLLQGLPANAAPVAQREIMLAVIPLDIELGNTKAAKTLIASLANQGRQTHDQTAIVMAMAYEVSMMLEEGRTGESFEIIEQALVIARTIPDHRVRNQVYSVAGALYSKVGNFQVALQHELNALDSLSDTEGTQSDLNRARVLNNISKLYLRLKDPQKALDYNAQADKLLEKIGPDALMADIAISRGYAYADQNRWDAAIAAYTKGLKISTTIGSIANQTRALNNLADAALNLEHYPECVMYAEKAISVGQQAGKNQQAAVDLGNLGTCHIYMGKVAQGVAEFERGIQYLRKANDTPQIEMMLDDLASAYKKVGLYREALAAREEQQKLAAELFHTERDRAVLELQARFDVNQRQKAIDALEQKNRLQSAEIENKSLQRIVSILATMVALAATIFVFLLYRRVRKSNRALRETNSKLEHKSTHDPLTGLLNRGAFQDYLASQRQNLVDENKRLPGILLLIDIDHFKLVNDTHGHDIGDLVLVEMGKRLQSILREKDLLMRWGGEEFLIYLHSLPVDRITRVVEQTLRVVGDAPIICGGKSVRLTISIGYIQIPLCGAADAEVEWQKSLKLCDIALYLAKNGGRNQAVGIEGESATHIATMDEKDLQQAIDNGTFVTTRVAGPL